MNCIELMNLPRIRFSHRFERSSYENSFLPKKHFIEITYVAEGTLSVTRGGRDFLLQKGDVLCNLHTHPTTVCAKEFHRHHTVGIELEWMPAEEEARGFFLPFLLQKKNNTAEICRIIDDVTVNALHLMTHRMQGAAKGMELLRALDEQGRRLQQSTLPSEQRYADLAKGFIHKNSSLPLSQSAVAKELGISPEYLCAVFKKSEGTTVMQYINRVKLEQVRALMQHTHLHLYEAAALCGYAHPNYVSRLYKKIYGRNITEK